MARTEDAWRSTIMSGDIASRLSAVSASVSPLTTLEVPIAMLSVSALRLLGDLERRPRPRAGLIEQVDDRLASQRRHLLDRPGADFLHRLGSIQDELDLLGDSSAMPRRSLRLRAVTACFRSTSWLVVLMPHLQFPERPRPRRQSQSADLHAFLGCSRQVLPNVIRLDRQLAMTAVDQHDELNRLRPAVVDQGIECGARRPPVYSTSSTSRIFLSSIEN